MTDDSKCPPNELVTKPRQRHTKNGQMMRRMVRNMVTHMEYVLKDIQAIMGEIKTLVVQIDSVTKKIDAHCNKPQQENHVVRKPEMIDCQTYWSRTISRKAYKENRGKNKQPLNDSLQGYEVPVFPSSLCPPENPLTQRLDSPSKLSNVERWLVQENARCYERIIRTTNSKTRNRKPMKSVKFGDNQGEYKRRPYGCTDLNYSESRYTPHVVKQPNVKNSKNTEFQETIGSSEQLQFLKGGASSRKKQTNLRYEEVSTDVMLTASHSVTTNSSLYLLPQISQIPSSESSHKMMHVYNSRYEENTSNTDDSPIESHPAHPPEKIPKEFNVIMPHFRHSKRISNKPKMKTEHTSAFQESHRIVQQSYGLPVLSKTYSKSSRPVSRNQNSLETESHKYQSLESDLDSINDCHDPRCLTPDMDWSYLGLMGSSSNRMSENKSTKHVYETIASPVFRRRRTKYACNITKSFSFQSSTEVGSQLICVENVNFVSETPESDHSGKDHCFSSGDSSIRHDIEELSRSVTLDHVFCGDVPDPYCDAYCGYYETIADAVLENISGYSSLEEACADLESRSEILEDTYIGFDDDFFDDEWDIGVKSSSEYYYEDDINLSLSVMPPRRINIQSKFFENAIHNPYSQRMLPFNPSAISQTVTCREIDIYSPEPLRCPQHTIINNEQFLPSDVEGMIHYDDLAIFAPVKHEENFTLSNTLEGSKAKQTLFWDNPKSQASASNNDDNNSISSDEISDEAMTSGSSNMSFGSVDVSITPPECDKDASLRYDADPSQFISSSPTQCSDDLPLPSACTPMKENQENTSSKCTESVGSAFQEVGSHPKNSSVMLRQESLQSARRSSIPAEIECEGGGGGGGGGSTDESIAYNRNVNTWTAYAMVHVPADEISDSASDIINDNSVTSVNSVNSVNSINNSVTNSMSSSYIDADNSAVAQINQGFVDA